MRKKFNHQDVAIVDIGNGKFATVCINTYEELETNEVIDFILEKSSSNLVLHLPVVIDKILKVEETDIPGMKKYYVNVYLS